MQFDMHQLDSLEYPASGLQPSELDLSISRHPKLYFPDGNIVIKVFKEGRCGQLGGAVLYRLSSTTLALRSEKLAKLFSIQNYGSEGSSDEKPLLLQGLHTGIIEPWLEYVFLGHQENKSNQWKFNVLEMSVFFENADGRQWALSQLPDLPHPSPASILNRAVEYRVAQWVARPLRQLLESPDGPLSLEDAGLLGANFLWIITDARQKINMHRRVLATQKPSYVQHPTCTGSRWGKDCSSGWRWEWTKIAEHLLHPEEPMSCSTVLHQLQQVRISDVCDPCEDSTIKDLIGTGALQQEERLILKAITQGEKYAGSGVDSIAGQQQSMVRLATVTLSN